MKWISTVMMAVFSTALSLSGQEIVSPLTTSFPAYEKHKRETMFNLNWISMGPVVNSARADCFQIDPADPATMYVGFSSGNIWKTTNNGLSWKPILPDMPSSGIGDFALAPSDTRIIYVGTGDNLKKPRNFTIPGDGVYRSDDAGETWRYLGLGDSWHIGEIKVHPTNPDIAFVAVLGHFWSTNENRGVYRTLDGGKAWEHVLYIDEKTGANDIVIAPSDPDIVYASMWEMYPDVAGPNSSVHKSTDGGKTWAKLSGGLPDGLKTGRIGIAVSYTDYNKVYVLADNLNRDKNSAAEVYLTTDGGKSWSRTHKEDLMIFAGLGWYFTDIYVNPTNDEEIYAMGIRIAHSADGGKSFTLVGGDVFHINPSTADVLHLDQTEFWINPANSKHIAVGNDGGLYVSYDKGASWMHYNNIPAGEFYDLTTGRGKKYTVYGGTQDNATVYGPSEEWESRFPDKWEYLWLDAWSGGDGCISQVDRDDPNTVYFSSQYGAIRRKNLSTGKSVPVQPRLPGDIKGELKNNYITPYFISPHNSQTLYHAGNFVFRSPNRGDNWKLISGDMSISADPEKKSTAAGAIAESPLKPGLIYMGTDRGAFMVTMNDGISWEEHSAGLPNNYIRSIFPSKYKESRVYIALTGINYDDLGSHVYVSEDYGTTWKSLTSNLPNEIVNVITEDPLFEEIIYVGTIRGVYLSLNRGLEWSLLGRNLPSVPVSDIEIQNDAIDIVISTYGRGIYRMNLNPVHESFEARSLKKGNFLLSVPEATLPWYNDTHRDPNFRTAEKVAFTFLLSSDSKASLKIVDKNGNALWERSEDLTKGLNQFMCDLVIKNTDSPLPYFYTYKQFISPGSYSLVLEVNGQIMERELIVKAGNKKPD